MQMAKNECNAKRRKNVIFGKMLNPGALVQMQTRPSDLEVPPHIFGLSKSILPIDHGIAGDHQIAEIIK